MSRQQSEENDGSFWWCAFFLFCLANCEPYRFWWWFCFVFLMLEVVPLTLSHIFAWYYDIRGAVAEAERPNTQ